MPTSIWFYVIVVIIILIVGFVGAIVGYGYRKKFAEKEIGGAEEEAKKILNDAIKAAEAKKRESIVEAREEIYNSRNEFEGEVKSRRSELQQQEQRLVQKEELLDKKSANNDAKEEKLSAKMAEAETRLAEIEQLKADQMATLERISEFTADDAKNYLIKKVEVEAQHGAALKLIEINQQLAEDADIRAQEAIATAIQRCAADHTSEVTVSVVPLPNDEMKGRIIGREGRNIRALETLTGVDLIIDDTPEAITLSAFDPVRREVARITLESLITDGRIHPTRIEEMVVKAKAEVEATVKQEGERAMFETGVHGLHPEIIKTIGRMKYRTSYGQNVLSHSIEVSHMAGLLAAELGADVTMAKRAGLLHDLGKAVDHEIEGSHVQIGVDLARKYKESEEVIHAIEAHHGDVEAHTVVACLVQAADAISAARPGARRENLEAYIKRLEKLEELAENFEGVERCFAIQAGREIRIIVKPEVISDDKMVLLAHELAQKIEREMSYPGQIKVHVVRETRAIEYAK